MSVFVNLNVNANRDDTVLARFESSTNGEDILVNPSDYSVGIARFKIPLSSIPVYRLYENDMCFHFDGTIMGEIDYPGIGGGDITSTKKYTSKGFSDFLNLTMVSSNFGRYGIDTLNGSKKFVDLYSQQDWLNHMNKVCLKSYDTFYARSVPNGYTNSMSGGATNNGTEDFIVVDKGTTATTNTSGQFNGVRDSIATTIVNRNTTSVGMNKGEFITGFDFDIPFYTTLVGDIDLGDIMIEIVKTSIDETQRDAGDKATILVKPFGTLVGVRPQYYTIGTTADDDRTNEGIRFSTSGASYIGIEELRDDVAVNAYRSSSSSVASAKGNPFECFPSCGGLNQIIGSRLDNFIYTIRYTSRKNYGSASLTFVNARLTIRTGLMTNYPNNERSATSTSIPNNKFLMPPPQFNINSEGKFVYTQNSVHTYYNNLGFFMNQSLSTLFSFYQYKSKKIQGSYFETFNATETALYSGKLNGEVYNFSSEVNALLPSGDYVELGDNVSYEEGFNSKFSRDWLNKIIITTGRLAIEGEFTGDGDQKIKVLTDFTIDPASTSRDYLVFTNQGGMRFYTIKSQLPIKTVDTTINFQDIYGIIRPLEILPYEECDVKIEFRPNAMLYSTLQPISSFDF